jgi:hypothetical protein
MDAAASIPGASRVLGGIVPQCHGRPDQAHNEPMWDDERGGFCVECFLCNDKQMEEEADFEGECPVCSNPEYGVRPGWLRAGLDAVGMVFCGTDGMTHKHQYACRACRDTLFELAPRPCWVQALADPDLSVGHDPIDMLPVWPTVMEEQHLSTLKTRAWAPMPMLSGTRCRWCQSQERDAYVAAIDKYRAELTPTEAEPLRRASGMWEFDVGPDGGAITATVVLDPPMWVAFGESAASHGQ